MSIIPSSAATPAVARERALLQGVIRNRLHVAACATAGAWAWGSLLRCTPSALDLAAVAAVVLCTYQWNRLTDRREDAINCPDELAVALAHRRGIEIVCATLLGIVVVIAAVQGSPAKTAVLALAVVLAFCYGPPIRLKSKFLLKNLSSSLGWTLLTVIYPALGVLSLRDGALWLAAACMFGAVGVVELLWDLRDVDGDAAAGVRSLPVIAGRKATLVALFFVNTIPALLVLIGIAAHVLRIAWIFVLINTAVVSLLLIAFGDDFSGSRRPWTHLLVMIQSILLVGLGAVAHLL
jgi:4-hydroxybenzoate polyprenyltransferase